MDKKLDTFYPRSRQEWREWLAENHDSKTSIWLVQYKKDTQIPSISWSDAVDEALCFGWIDSTRKSLDESRFIQFFTRRKPTSTWSKINKTKVAKLIEAGSMHPAGLKTIEIAKENGTWNILDSVEELLIPNDLDEALKSNDGVKDFFLSQSKSVRKMMLHWIVMAKRDETRQKRILEVAEAARKGIKLKPL